MPNGSMSQNRSCCCFPKVNRPRGGRGGRGPVTQPKCLQPLQGTQPGLLQQGSPHGWVNVDAAWVCVPTEKTSWPQKLPRPGTSHRGDRREGRSHAASQDALGSFHSLTAKAVQGAKCHWEAGLSKKRGLLEEVRFSLCPHLGQWVCSAQSPLSGNSQFREGKSPTQLGTAQGGRRDRGSRGEHVPPGR